MKIRSHLVLLVCAAMLPVLVFAGLVVASLWEQQRAAAAQSYLGHVRALALALDTEIEASTRRLQGIAIDSDFDLSPDSGFVGRARRVLATQPTWSTIVAVDPEKKATVAIGPTVFDPTGAFVDETTAAHRPRIGPARGFRLPAHARHRRRGHPDRGPAPAGQRRHARRDRHDRRGRVGASLQCVRHPAPRHRDPDRRRRARSSRARSTTSDGRASPLRPASSRRLPILRKKVCSATPAWMASRSNRRRSARAAPGGPSASAFRSTAVESALLGPTLGMGATGLLATLLAIAAAFFLGRRIALPVAGLAESAKALARGEAPRDRRQAPHRGSRGREPRLRRGGHTAARAPGRGERGARARARGALAGRRGQPRKGRVPRHAGPRAAQSAARDHGGHGGPGSRRRAQRACAALARDRRAPDAAPDRPGGRPSRRRARHLRQDRARPPRRRPRNHRPAFDGDPGGGGPALASTR